MPELVANCPRCGASRITFDLVAAIKTGQYYGWQFWYEAFCICRQCRQSTTFVLSESVNGNYEYVHKKGLTNLEEAVNRYVNIEGTVTLKDSASVEPPAHVPKLIEAVFREGATCLAVRCYNAAGTMFRLCIDLVTRTLLPEDDTVGLNRATRRNLGLRLPWLFDSKRLPEGLRELSACVKEDGNDGVMREPLRRGMRKIFLISHLSCLNVYIQNLKDFGLPRSGEETDGAQMHNTGFSQRRLHRFPPQLRSLSAADPGAVNATGLKTALWRGDLSPELPLVAVLRHSNGGIYGAATGYSFSKNTSVERSVPPFTGVSAVGDSAH